MSIPILRYRRILSPTLLGGLLRTDLDVLPGFSVVGCQELDSMRRRGPKLWSVSIFHFCTINLEMRRPSPPPPFTIHTKILTEKEKFSHVHGGRTDTGVLVQYSQTPERQGCRCTDMTGQFTGTERTGAYSCSLIGLRECDLCR